MPGRGEGWGCTGERCTICARLTTNSDLDLAPPDRSDIKRRTVGTSTYQYLEVEYQVAVHAYGVRFDMNGIWHTYHNIKGGSIPELEAMYLGQSRVDTRLASTGHDQFNCKVQN